MGRASEQPVTFYVPEVFITVSMQDIQRLVAELRRSSRDRRRDERLRVADRPAKAVEGELGAQRIVVPDLPDDEQQALLRAVEHLRLASGGMSKQRGRLHFALKGRVPMQHISYDVVFGYGGDKSSFTSYTGSYEVGDRLPCVRPGECWEVVAFGTAREDSERESLIVEPCREGDLA
jgi:hypothetical protein